MEIYNSEIIERIETLSAQNKDLVNEMWRYVAPDLVGLENARKATLLMLASGQDRGGRRGRIHILLEGEPGTGKSDLRNWTKWRHPDAVGIGPSSTEAGLKGDFSGGERTPGALEMAHNGILCIEELEKFRKSDREALLEAMSEGFFEVNKGKHRLSLNAEIRCIATCNDTSKLSSALLDRFDFRIKMEGYDEDATVEITDGLLDGLWQSFIENQENSQENPVMELLRWIDAFEPSGEPEALDTIKNMYRYLIKEKGQTGDIRRKEAYFRAAYAYAKLCRSDLTPLHLYKVLELMHPEMELNGAKAIATGNVAELYG